MSEEHIREMNERMETIQKLDKAPSQHKIFFHLLGTGRTMTVKEISGELGMTPKATERAVAKLVEKDLIQKASFRQAAYSCDSKQIILGLLLTVTELRKKLGKRGI
jgi:predicted transcriptional regulator